MSHRVFQRGLVPSLPHTDPSVRERFSRRLLVLWTLGHKLPCDLRGPQRNRSSTDSTTLPRSGPRHVVQNGGHSKRHAESLSPGPALTTWSNAAARHVITKLIAKCLLASRASVLHDRCTDWVLCFLGRRHQRRDSLVTRPVCELVALLSVWPVHLQASAALLLLLLPTMTASNTRQRMAVTQTSDETWQHVTMEGRENSKVPSKLC